MDNQMNKWNDDRLDELNRRVENGFASVDQHFIRLEGEMKEGFAKVDKRFTRVDERFEQVDRRFEQVATRESVAEVNARLDRLGVRIDRLYWAFILLVLMLGGNLIANGGG